MNGVRGVRHGEVRMGSDGCIFVKLFVSVLDGTVVSMVCDVDWDHISVSRSQTQLRGKYMNLLSSPQSQLAVYTFASALRGRRQSGRCAARRHAAFVPERGVLLYSCLVSILHTQYSRAGFSGCRNGFFFLLLSLAIVHRE